MPRQPDAEKVRALYHYLTSLQVELVDVLDGPPNQFRADSVALLTILEQYYGDHLRPRLIKRG